MLATPAQAAPGIRDYQVEWGLDVTEVEAGDLPVDSSGWTNLAPITDTAQAVFDWLDSNWGSLGDVTGPGSSTEHAIARYADTTGKVIENSEWLVDDDGTLVNTSLGTLNDYAIFADNGSSTAATLRAQNGSSSNSAYEFAADRYQIDYFADLKEWSSPPNDPPPGYGRLAAYNDGTVHYINDGSLDIELGAAFSGIGLAADIGSPSLLEDGDTLTQAGGDGLDSSVSGDTVTFAVDETVVRQGYTTAANFSINNFTAETVVANITVPANDFEDGSILRFKAYGSLTAFTGTPTFTIRLRYNGTGGTALATWTRASLGAGKEIFEFDADINVQSLGGSGTCRTAGLYETIDVGGTFRHVQSNAGSATTIDTTASKTYDLTVQCSAASLNTIAAFDIVSIERLK